MEQYLALLKNMGAAETKLIKASDVVTASWVAFKCQFGCDFFGKSHCCPPKTPTYQQTQRMLDVYETSILFKSHKMKVIKEIAVVAARQLFLDGYYKVIAFGSGPCSLCKPCNPEHCSMPKKAVPSMEACGIDVFSTVQACGFEIHVVQNKEDEQNYFGLLLIE